MPSNSTEQDGDVRRSRELDPRVPDVALARIQCHKLDFPHLIPSRLNIDTRPASVAE
jgi:hypothetical protein